MYDSKNERHEFVAGNRDDALRKATDYFGVEAEALRIGDFPEGAIYGLGGRAVIVASLKDRKVPTPGRSGGGRDREGGREERGGGRGRRERGDRGDRGGRGGGRGGSRRDASDRDSDRPAAGTEELTSEPSVGSPRGVLGEIGTFLLGTIERMQIGPFEIAETAEGELVAFEVSGAAAAQLAGGDGRPVDALQLLAHQVAARDEDGPKRVVLDVEGNADAREDFLSSLATRAAGRAQKTGRSVALDPMNGRDRRSIHLALRDEDDVATMSIGEGRYRQVVIVPAGAPEYEDARRESQAAQSND
jgi:predicted RNA-binding protein Jag